MSKGELPKLPYLDGPLSHPLYSKVGKRIIDLVLALLMLGFNFIGDGLREALAPKLDDM